jgi:alpha-1,2-mannosyltransferase
MGEFRFFFGLVAVRVLAALLAPIPDCDEVFNYWEPMTYLVHG